MYIELFILLLSLTAFCYIMVILIITIGWYRMKNFTSSVRGFSTRVSVVVAYRNESNHIEKFLESITKQTYPDRLWELVLVNDHSEDNGLQKINKFIPNHKNITIRLIDAEGEGKKTALLEGVRQANGRLIVTTDADCRVSPNWLANMVAFYEQEHPLLILGPVVYENEKGFLQKLFSLDFMSLVASGAGSASKKLPLMGNGANMAFEKDVFLEAGAEAQKHNFASGDDVFLVHYLAKEFGKQAVRFIKNRESMVFTAPPANLKTFLHQRVRWGSKAKAYELVWPLLVAFSVFLFNGLLVASFFVSFFIPWFSSIFLLFILLKFVVDLPLMQAFSDFSNKRNLLVYLLPFEFIYPFYILYAAFKGIFFRYEWKGRKTLR